jgi:hypothetical protein
MKRKSTFCVPFSELGMVEASKESKPEKSSLRCKAEPEQLVSLDGFPPLKGTRMIVR